MRLILDLHISGRRVGRALGEDGHNIRATDAEEEIFDSMGDEDLLQLAYEDGRILISRNVRDFPKIAGQWDLAGRPHAGIIMVPNSIDHSEHGVIVAGVRHQLSGTHQADWKNRFRWIRRASG